MQLLRWVPLLKNQEKNEAKKRNPPSQVGTGEGIGNAEGRDANEAKIKEEERDYKEVTSARK